MSNLEAVGDAITGGVIGRAVEPRAGEAAAHARETHCLNCGAELQGDYCHVCGQHGHVHRTLHAFFHDLVHGVFHFEGKFWNTLPMLAWRPGELTRRYIDGQRARFVSPIALFLFSVFLMFSAIGLTSHSSISTKASADAARDLQKDQQKLAVLESQRATATGPVAAKLDEKIGDLKGEIAALQAVKAGKIDPTTFKIQSDWFGGKDGLFAKATQNPELLFYKIKTNAYKFSWALIPISVPFIWLLFPFSRRFKLYDHTVFVTYSLCFMTLLVVAGVLFGAAGLASVAALLWLLPPFHMYRQLKGTYALTGWGALWRTMLLVVFAWIAISLFVSLLVTIGVLD